MISNHTRLLLSLIYIFAGYWLYINFPEKVYNEYPVHLNMNNEHPSSDLNITLQPFKKYSMHLEVEMPDSEVNRDIGMFSLEVDIKKKKKEQRTFLLEYFSPVIRNIRDVSWSPIYMINKGRYIQRLKNEP